MARLLRYFLTVARGTPSFKLNPEKPNYVPRENLIVLAKTDGSYVEVESYAEGNSLHCNVNADTVYLIADGSSGTALLERAKDLHLTIQFFTLLSMGLK